jgi:anti-sigma B factor antagonist
VRIRTDAVDECTTVCRVGGELDAYTAPDLRDSLDGLLEKGARWIVVDLKDLTYLDSTGLGILVGTAKKCRQAGGDLSVACQRRNLVRIFEISGTQEILNMVATAEEAATRLQELHEGCPEDASGEEAT